MSEIELSTGTIDYHDTGGPGPVVVLLHGLMMDASLWDGPLAGLDGRRCVVPTLPLGAHRRPMRDGADLSLAGAARLTAELLDRLDLHDVTLVGNDTGGAIIQLLLAAGAPERVRRVVLVSCEAFDNYPARVTGTTLALTGKLPPALFGLFMQQMRVRLVRRLPIAFGRLTMRGDAATARWMRPVLQQPAIRRDAVRTLRAAPADARLLRAAAGRLPGFTGPALVVWATGDRVMPIEHGRRLAELFPQGRLTEVPDTATLIPLDQPAALARLIHDFTAAAHS